MSDKNARELLFNEGGRPYNNKDFIEIQKKIQYLETIYNNFTVDGEEAYILENKNIESEFTGDSNNLENIGDSGFVWLAGKVRYVQSNQAVVGLSQAFIKRTNSFETRIYGDESERNAFIVYGAIWDTNVNDPDNPSQPLSGSDIIEIIENSSIHDLTTKRLKNNGLVYKLNNISGALELESSDNSINISPNSNTNKIDLKLGDTDNGDIGTGEANKIAKYDTSTSITYTNITELNSNNISSVGINVESPTGALDVTKGDITLYDENNTRYLRIGKTSTSNMSLYYNLSNNSCYIKTQTNSAASNFYLMNGNATAISIDSSNNVGIGVSSPSYSLDVDGNTRIKNDSSVGLLFGDYWKTQYTIGGETYTGKFTFRLENSSADISIMSLDSNKDTAGFNVDGGIRAGKGMYVGGDVGIGINNPSQKLDVNGNIKGSSLYLSSVIYLQDGTKNMSKSYYNSASNEHRIYPADSNGNPTNTKLKLMIDYDGSYKEVWHRGNDLYLLRNRGSIPNRNVNDALLRNGFWSADTGGGEVTNTPYGTLSHYSARVPIIMNVGYGDTRLKQFYFEGYATGRNDMWMRGKTGTDSWDSWVKFLTSANSNPEKWSYISGEISLDSSPPNTIVLTGGSLIKSSNGIISETIHLDTRHGSYIINYTVDYNGKVTCDVLVLSDSKDENPFLFDIYTDSNDSNKYWFYLKYSSLTGNDYVRYKTKISILNAVTITSRGTLTNTNNNRGYVIRYNRGNYVGNIYNIGSNSNKWVKIGEFHGSAWSYQGGVLIIQSGEAYGGYVMLHYGLRYNNQGVWDTNHVDLTVLQTIGNKSTDRASWGLNPATDIKLIRTASYKTELWIKNTSSYRSASVYELSRGKTSIPNGYKFFMNSMPTSTEPTGSQTLFGSYDSTWLHNLTVDNNITIPSSLTNEGAIRIYKGDSTYNSGAIYFDGMNGDFNGADYAMIYAQNDGEGRLNINTRSKGLYIDENKAWHAGNDGSGSGLDADTVDGYHASDLYNNTAIQVEASDNLDAGWYTIATNTGDRAIGRFGIRDTAGSRHSATIFYATHHYGTDSSNEITVLTYSKFSGAVFNSIRIKDNGTYDGAVLQVYVNDSSNDLIAYLLGDNFQASGWVLKNFIPDATNPGDVSNYSSMTAKTTVNLTNIQYGGMITTGEIYAGGQSSQYKVWHQGNDGSNSGLDADTVDGKHASAFALASHRHGTNKFDDGSVNAPSIAFNSNSDTGFFINNSDIGVTINNSEKFRFESDGDFHADGDVIAYSSSISSDIRIKKNITNINSNESLNIIEQLNPVSFEFINKPGVLHNGFIAQEVEEIIPHIINEHESLEDNKMYKGIRYTEIIPYNTAAIKELNNKIKEQEQEINYLKNELNEIKKLLNLK